MKTRYRMFFAVVLILVATGLVMGCSRFMGPSNEEALAAINDSSILKQPNIKLDSPIEILEKGKRGQDGSWPFKVKMTLKVTMIDGKTTKSITTTPTFRLMQKKDESGKVTWIANVGA